MRWKPDADGDFRSDDRDFGLDDFRFPLAGPPRPVPLSLRLRILFGGVCNQFGWIFLGFGLVFVWIFVAHSDLTGWYDFRGPLRTESAVVTKSEKTNASEGGDEHRSGTPIYANHYRFECDGRTYEGISYAPGIHFAEQATVTVEFPVGNPARSRIQGMRPAIFPPWVLFVVIFPAIGLGFVAFGLLSGRKAVHLLAHGEPGLGVLKSKSPTSTQVNGQTVHRFTFEFTAADGRTYETVVRTHRQRSLEDDAQEPLLYLPDDPTHSTMLDHLPGSPRIDDAGRIQSGGPWSGVWVTILPGLTILGHGLYFSLRYLR